MNTTVSRLRPATPITTTRLLLPAAAMVLAVMGIAVAGCREKHDASANASRRPRVALVMKSLANEFFSTMERGAAEHQREHASAYELVANGIKDELDVSKQIELVEQMIAQKVDAIVIAPADSKALVPVCKRAQEAGIVVVNIDNKFDETVLAASGVRFPFVGPDNRKGARKVGDYLATKLSAGDAVIIVEGAPGAFNGRQRTLGFEDAAKAAGLKVVASQSGYWETERANQVVASLIIEHPETKAVLCANDSMALGAVPALQAAGRLDKVLIVGFDNIAAAQRLIRDGKLLATADQHGDQLAAYGIEYALDLLAKKTAPADRETPVDLVTAATLGAR